ncbi:glycosyltransferase family 2 protein [bacterium]|nr:glycosyltransferase family 2 protein [bacterium]MBU3956310.1 glycosyltransferase family 2 protein [bacterium]
MIWVWLPAYNEAGGIEELLINIKKSLEIRGLEYKLVVYDDGSSDNTVNKILSTRSRDIDIELIKGEVNKGLGYALFYFIKHCTLISSPDDIIVIMDADNTHNPELIYQMYNYIQIGFDIVIASRYTPYSRMRGVNLYRQFLSRVASIIFKMFFPIKGVSDYTCGYRAYTAGILKLASDIYGEKLIEERGFACMAELLIKLRRLDIIACEVPLILRYDKKVGDSKMEVLFTVFRTFGVIFKLMWLPGFNKKPLAVLKKKYNI